MRWLNAGFWTTLATAGILCVSRFGAAQQDAKDTVTLQTYSRLTVLDVTATDADGQPIYGLKQSNFTILEDGKPQLIRNFEEVAVRPVMPTHVLPPHVYTNLHSSTPSPAVNILLLDFANEAPVDSTNTQQVSQAAAMQKRVKDASIEAVQSMPAGTCVAVLSLTDKLRIVQSFTSDPYLLAAAIAAIPYDLQGNGNNQETLAQMGAPSTVGHTPSSSQGVQRNNRNRMVLEALDQIATSSAAVKGRKNLIWFTVGIPDITDPSERPPGLPDYSRGLSEMYERLTAAQVSIYPIDAAGAVILGPRQLSEQSVAEATGGLAYSETNDMAQAVLKSIDNGANYYSIAYAPPSQKYDGVYHTIDVKVDQPGVRLVFRKGYYADDLSKEKLPAGLSLSTTPPPSSDGNMKAPMSRGLPTSDQVLFQVGVDLSNVIPKPGDPPVLGTLDPKLKGKHLTRYTFQYVVPGQQIKFTDGPNKTHKGVLEFDIAVYDSTDKLLTGLSQVVRMALTEISYQQQVTGQQPIHFSQQIDLPPGQLFIRVGVLDHISNDLGTLELPLTIGQR